MSSTLDIVTLASSSRGTDILQTGADGKSLSCCLRSSASHFILPKLWIQTPSSLRVGEETSHTAVHSLLHSFMKYLLSTFYMPETGRDVSDGMEVWWDVFLIIRILKKSIVYETFLPLATQGPPRSHLILYLLYPNIISSFPSPIW